MTTRSKILLAAGALLFAAFVWPTRYRDLTLAGNSARQDRFTGKCEIFAGGVWRQVGDGAAEAADR